VSHIQELSDAYRIVLTKKEDTLLGIYRYIKTPWILIRKQTIPTERQPLVGEVSANFCG
jgi:hypothetical protein